MVEAALLPKLIGQGRARRLLLSGETIGAGEALAWGLVDIVAPAGGLDDALDGLVYFDPRSRASSGPSAEVADPRVGGIADRGCDSARH